MKSYEHIQPAELDEEPAPEGEVWKRDQLILKLIHDGHKPISVGRATMIVTQCESGDEFPKGWCEEPLRIAVYAIPMCQVHSCHTRSFYMVDVSALCSLIFGSTVRMEAIQTAF